jgi:hypothetical protein
MMPHHWVIVPDVSKEHVVFTFKGSLGLASRPFKLKTCSFEISEPDYPLTLRHIPKEGSPEPHGDENVETRKQ